MNIKTMCMKRSLETPHGFKTLRDIRISHPKSYNIFMQRGTAIIHNVKSNERNKTLSKLLGRSIRNADDMTIAECEVLYSIHRNAKINPELRQELRSIYGEKTSKNRSRVNKSNRRDSNSNRQSRGLSDQRIYIESDEAIDYSKY